MSTWRAIVLLAAAAVAGAAGAAQLDPARIVSLREVEDPQVSPRGDLVAYVVREFVGDGKERDADIWVVPVEGEAPARLFVGGPENQTQPRWSPDGSRIAFVSASRAAGDEPSTGAELIAVSRDGRERHVLHASGTEITGFAWLNGGRRIALTKRDGESEEQRTRRAQGRDEKIVGANGMRARLWLLDLATGAANVLTPEALHVSDFDASPEGARFAVRVADTPGMDDFWYRSRVVLVDASAKAASSTVPPVLSDRAGAMQLRWSPDGSRVALSHIRPSGVVASPRIMDAATGRLLDIDLDYPGTIWHLEWERGGRTLIGQALEGTQATLIRVDAATGKVSRLGQATASQPGLSLSENGRVLAWLGQSDREPNEIWIRTSGQSRARTRTHPQVADWPLGEVRRIEWRSRKDGRTIEGLLVLPPGYRDGTPTKTVVQLHGGPLWSWWYGWLCSWHEWAQWLASHGYAVFLPNPRGSEGRGIEFAEASIRDWGGADFQDVLDGLDWLVAQHIADPERVGIGGWSYGGYLSAWAVANSDRFRAAVVGAAVTDLLSMNGTSDIAQGYLPPYVGDPVREADEYRARSPVTYATRVRSPVLILHGEDDPRVPPTQGLQLYNELRRAGKPVEMVLYPREPHWFRERAHQEDVLRRTLAFFDRHLAAEP